MFKINVLLHFRYPIHFQRRSFFLVLSSEKHRTNVIDRLRTEEEVDQTFRRSNSYKYYHYEYHLIENKQ
jgi:hypothetical protein